MRNHLIFICACCFFAAACGSKTNTAASTNAPANANALVKTDAPKTAVAVEVANACSVENDKKIVEISGYLDGDEGVPCMEINAGAGDYNCAYRLKGNSADKKGMKANIAQGTSANQAEKLSPGYTRKDIKIHAADGQIINVADKAKLTGVMTVESGGSVCSLKVTKVEK